MLQPLELDKIIEECRGSCMLGILRIGCETENHCFGSSTFHSSSLEQVTYLKIPFCQLGCEPELNMEVNLVGSIEEDDAFQEGRMWLGDEKNFDHDFHKSVVIELGGNDELCDGPEVGSNEGEEEGY